MSKKVNPELMKHDKRIIARKLLVGEISEKELHAYLKKLPDAAELAEEVSIDTNTK